jgi:hypothetical protein
MSLKTTSYLELSHITEVLDRKHHQNYLYDLNKSNLHFYDWCDKKGYTKNYRGVDKQGHEAGSSQIWFKEYNQAKDGLAQQPESLNFWSYCFDHYLCDSSSNFFYFDKNYDLSGHPQWIKQVYLEICQEFGHHFPDGIVTVLNES